MSSEPSSFRVISRNSGFWLEKNGWTFNLAPPEMVKISMPPDCEGLDWFVREASRIKEIRREFMRVNFSEVLFLGCDASLSYSESSFGGWIYSLQNEFLDFRNHRRMWICGQMKLYFEKPPQRLFISLEGEYS